MQGFNSPTDDLKRRPGGFDSDDLTSPMVFLWSMLVFLALAGFVAAVLGRQITSAFSTNPGLNGLIVGVLTVGILLALIQIVRLAHEVRWVNAYRNGSDEFERMRDPVLLAPMRALIGRRQSLALNTQSMRAVLDSVATRLDETRDIARYLTGLLVFLGLLGTFWGLLGTIGSIGDTIRSLDPGGGDTSSVLDALKAGLAAPLEGMGTAFSSSLFGLSGSLVLGFLDLQIGRAQNRFYTELENWLSSVTDVGSDVALSPISAGSGSSTEEVRLLAERLAKAVAEQGVSTKTSASMASLAESIQGLVQHMRSEQQLLRDFVEAQAGEQRELRGVLERLASSITPPRREG
ncbi:MULTISPECIES: MotA/TolQ/ExbB proton channel family protein [unclassified Aureimonas]|uniref:MotA/TolQ/ExbB proton channel family protein n=1 Tax=unclassified Aureimonas TaxID=2615206 RepID=UPI0006F6648C|nr:MULTISPECIES: MotA/TolQ/ExbB proton channel family protein [unclassified Aureimonas]KQT52148.1 flagellar motor protein MotA [Aureimonas sp. Leaf427]KQT70618.1 flagellar motor protein MotA [Aureimonas sp. Leaf460]